MSVPHYNKTPGGGKELSPVSNNCVHCKDCILTHIPLPQTAHHDEEAYLSLSVSLCCSLIPKAKRKVFLVLLPWGGTSAINNKSVLPRLEMLID